MTKALLAYTTLSSRDDAAELAKLLLSEKIIACANIMAEHQALYCDNGAIKQSTEVGMLLKLLPEQEDRLREALAQHHPYDVPALLLWHANTTADFYDFLKASCG